MSNYIMSCQNKYDGAVLYPILRVQTVVLRSALLFCSEPIPRILCFTLTSVDTRVILLILS